MKKNWAIILAVAVLGGLFGLFLQQILYGKPSEIPSALVNKAVPEFDLPVLGGDDKVRFTHKDLKQGKPVLVNVWASWCVACQAEHEVLLKMQKDGIPIYGLNSGDKPDLAQNYLDKMGNPFKKVIADPRREYAIALGTTGMPETFIIGKDGVIYYHYRGNLTDEIVKTKLRPIYDEIIKK